MDAPSLEFCQDLPKVELHAHLNGSLSKTTMRTLMHKKASKDQSSQASLQQWRTVIEKGETRQLDECFETFKLIHTIVDDEEAISMAARDVVADFAKDNVKYLELRTTPRANAQTGMSKRLYVEAVLRGLQQQSSQDIQVRLLLSIDRHQSLAEASDTVKLAQEYALSSSVSQQGKVVGIDLSGDPNVGNMNVLVPVLTQARSSGLKLALHIAERPDRDEENKLLVNIPPDRIGHGTFLHLGLEGVDSATVQTVLKKKIPIELCLTSNIKGRTVPSFSQHHLAFWLGKNHPYILCTDDKGVFSTSLSEEYKIAADTFSLSKKILSQLSIDSIQYIFDKNCQELLERQFKRVHVADEELLERQFKRVHVADD